MKLKAFTLAETLITIGIIGIVAAISIPGLIQNYKLHVLRTSFLKSVPKRDFSIYGRIWN